MKKIENEDNYNNKLKIIKKRRKILFFIISFLIFLILLLLGYKYLYSAPSLSIKKVYLNSENKLIIEIKKDNYSLNDEVYCLYTTSMEEPLYNDENWLIAVDNICEYELDQNNYSIYIKNKNNNISKISEVDNIGYIDNLKINEELYYLAVKEKLDLNVTYDKYGNVNDNVIWLSSNETVAEVNEGKVNAKSNGEVIVSAKVMDKEVSSSIIVTDLITTRPKNGFDYNKKKLSCNSYTKEENDLIDDILKFKVEKVGLKTRAGVVEAARFITLDFPYRISYFYENGRLGTNKVDGEGRYYHKGLYLDESRFDSISHSRRGPKTWGCLLYSVPDQKKDSNGLDCSGFVSLALLNGGYNPGDIGAGITSVKDLTDLGEKKKITSSILNLKTVKVGDLLHNTWAGGHIAIIVGINSNYYYVAQAIWFDEDGVVINKYSKNDIINKYDEVILMDKYYKKDGKLSNMW